MALKINRGTVTNNSTITTGLSSISQFVIYRKSMTSTGLLVGNYNESLGAHYSYCTTYGTYTKYVNMGSTAPTVSGGSITLPGTIGTDAYALASGIEYTWVAVGEE